MTGQELPRQFAKDNSRRAIRLGAVTGYKQPEDVRLFIVQRENYVYLVPLEGEHTLFLKTIIPSRKCDEEYLGEDSDHED